MVREQFPEAVILRPSVVFGPEDDFFNRFAEMARFSPVLPLIGGGKTRFQPVYVGDVADAAVAILDRPEDAPFTPAGKTYELAGPRIYSFKELMELLLAEIGRKRILLPVPWGIARAPGRGAGPAAPAALDPRPAEAAPARQHRQRPAPGLHRARHRPRRPRSHPPRLSRPLPRRRALRPGLDGAVRCFCSEINSGFCLPSDGSPGLGICFCRESAVVSVSVSGSTPSFMTIRIMRSSQLSES